MELTLRSGGLTAGINTFGGELVSLRDGEGREYIWNGDPAFWSGRNPILFPIVGALKEDRILFDGRPFSMGRHGFARRRDFAPVEQGEDFALLALEADGETMAQYPYPFRLLVEHRLEEGGFSTTFTVENPGEEPLPFCIGAHTAFRCPLEEGAAFEDYDLVFDREETCSTLVMGSGGLWPEEREPVLNGEKVLPLDHSWFDRLDTLIFDGLASDAVSLVRRTTGRGVRMTFTGFPVLAVWTKPGVRAPFVCLEPWHGLPWCRDEGGEFRDKPHAILLPPGERRSLTYRAALL